MPNEPPEAISSFPRRQARTRRFTLGQPRNFLVSEDGSRILFLRSAAGDDPVTSLWAFEVDSGEERLVCDARSLPVGSNDVPDAERARRERVREGAEGIVAYAADRGGSTAAFAAGGRGFLVDVAMGGLAELGTVGPVVDPRPDPTGACVAYVTGGELHVVGRDGHNRRLAAEDDPHVTWGLAEFVAAEEMDRTRGYWWAPDGSALAAARVDTGRVQRWHIANPADPAQPPKVVAYPAAGTENADVSLSVLALDGTRVDIDWDRAAFPYLVQVVWQGDQPLTLLVQSRDQRAMSILEVDTATGRVATVLRRTDQAWLEIVSGVPARLDDGTLVFTVDEEDTRKLTLGDRTVTPAGLQVSGVVDAGAAVAFTGSQEPTEVHLWRVAADGRLRRLTDHPGVHTAVGGHGVLVMTSATLDDPRVTTTVHRDGEAIGTIRSFAEDPGFRPEVSLVRLGGRELRGALLFPSRGGDGPFPVLLDPYGGPHFQRVVGAQSAFLASQWLADQGFAVLVADGRGTPGRGPAWEKSVRGDLASAVLEDQVDALRAAAGLDGRLDLSRVAMRGWSFGGYLSALAVLRRSDVFHAAVVGAPVTDWRLYDTHYTERYLGDPSQEPEAYRRSSLLDDAAKLHRPMLLIHGMADDNVVVAHTLRLSQALTEAGRSHTVLPLSGVTHMTPQEAIAENLLLLQVAFLREALGVGERRTADEPAPSEPRELERP